jgi:glycosyltransferase involved in cell wall biosynthesis
LEQFTSYPKDLREQLTLLVVDDGSPSGLKAQEYITLSHRQLLRIRIARVQINKPWNTPGARNLAFHVADTANVLMIDSDLLVPLETMRAVLTWKILQQEQQDDHHHVAHQFNRTRLDGTYKTHPSASYISVNAYWASGGCEEDFSGNYGSEDVAFWYHFEKHKNNQIVEHSEIFLHQFDKEPCEGVVPISMKKACREARIQLPALPRYIEVNQARFYSRIQKGCWSNRFLRFPWVLLEAE